MYLFSASADADQREAAAYFELWRLLDPSEIQNGLAAQAAEPDAAVGGPALPLYTGDYQAARTAFEKQYDNLPYANYSAFLDAISTGKAKLQVEPGPDAQQYYASVAAVVSSVLTDQGVDPATALKQAADDFQASDLDQIASN
jgi:hypothetical protein